MSVTARVHELNDDTQVACFGALLAMADVDGFMHANELKLIFDLLAQGGLGTRVQTQTGVYATLCGVLSCTDLFR